MEAGKAVIDGEEKSLDLIDAMVQAANPNVSDEDALKYERSACPTCGSCSGMFTANSMNCLTEALGLSLPGNGSVLATHADRRELFLMAGRVIVDLTRRYYVENDPTALPRAIANFEAFENAMTLDIAMGGSTNTVLHLLAAAHEGEVPFTMADIDRLSRRVPNLCKVAPSSPIFHLEDVHRAGGVMAILGELDRGGLIHRNAATVHSRTLVEALDYWDVKRTDDPTVHEFYRAAPGGVPTQVAFSPFFKGASRCMIEARFDISLNEPVYSVPIVVNLSDGRVTSSCRSEAMREVAEGRFKVAFQDQSDDFLEEFV